MYRHTTEEVVPSHHTANSYLRQEVAAGARLRWPDGVPEAIQTRIHQELYLITELSYEYYFLTVYDIVQFAKSRHILCQGRGSAANSVVCYCLHITEVSPEQVSLLFERFISRERDEPPDIDVDFEHERREEVIQYIYEKYSRRRAALLTVGDVGPEALLELSPRNGRRGCCGGARRRQRGGPRRGAPTLHNCFIPGRLPPTNLQYPRPSSPFWFEKLV